METQALNTTEAEAIAAIVKSHSDISTAFSVLAEAEDAHHMVALPEHFKMHDLEASAPRRRRARGKFTTGAVDSFLRYTHVHGERGASVFVDVRDMSACAVLNLGTQDAPGHTDNRAHLQLRQTAAMQALMAMDGKCAGQQAFAEWLEDWQQQVPMQFFAGDEEIRAKHAIAAVRRITVKAVSETESETQQLSATRSTFENVAASSRDNKLPTMVYFSTKPYDDLDERMFVARVSVLPSEKGVTLTLRVQNMGQHQEEMGAELAALITAGCAELPVYFGEYQAKG